MLPNANDESESQVPVTLLMEKVARVAVQRYAERLLDLDLRPRHMGFLTAVARLEDASQSQVGAWLGIGPSAVVALVDEMEARGAVTRAAHPASRRQWILQLTANGGDLLAAATEQARELDEEFLAALEPSDRKGFRAAMAAIAQGIGVGVGS